MSAKPISIRTSPIAMRGGSAKASAVSGTDGDVPSQTLTNKVASLWAASGVVMILGKSIKRILPIAMEPFNGVATPLSNFQLMYVQVNIASFYFIDISASFAKNIYY